MWSLRGSRRGKLARLICFVTERPTYDVAIRYLEYIRNEQFSDRPIIIVANKVDLVRKRQVSSDGKRFAIGFIFVAKYLCIVGLGGY
jgi:GTPase SAR1 family protein